MYFKCLLFRYFKRFIHNILYRMRCMELKYPPYLKKSVIFFSAQKRNNRDSLSKTRGSRHLLRSSSKPAIFLPFLSRHP